MSVQGVNSAYAQTTSIPVANGSAAKAPAAKPPKKESHAVRNGALIGGGIGAIGGIGIAACLVSPWLNTSISIGNHTVNVADAISMGEKIKCYGKYGIIGTIVTAIIGAGIGLIVKSCKSDKE